MPCLEVTMPAVDVAIKQTLATNLTDAFDEATSFGRDIFGIRFCEYEVGNAATAGQVWDGKAGRPYLHLLLYCPRVTRKTKQALVAGLTSAFTESLIKPDWKPVIHISEHPYDNVGVEGELLSDAYEQCTAAKFYYELPRD
ncbi:MAG: tautomerase family protein [candidate division Zixibacteria bacterium]|nr:tautomerase family protein [candidate division Zixibacteria bacterium]